MRPLRISLWFRGKIGSCGRILRRSDEHLPFSEPRSLRFGRLAIIRELDAVYENGVLRPLEPLPFGEAQRVHITVSATQSSASKGLGQMIDQGLLAELRAEVAAMQHRPTIADVREALSSIKGSMSDLVIEERGEY